LAIPLSAAAANRVFSLASFHARSKQSNLVKGQNLVEENAAWIRNDVEIKALNDKAFRPNTERRRCVVSEFQFDTFFRTVTGNLRYDFPRGLACGARNDRSEVERLADGTACRSQLIKIPTAWAKVLPAYEPDHGTTC
jgi:hypothetical protein